ncbi:unnamed protein product [Rhizoctonia solani]|uniref:F-box domain-containing protein n=1 Tax=Rhizoctonia solani TaxID=456999 RepID=A0A8H3BIU6_9AGAM|nr:unnamed protein product [Rhizoctonia solani]
MTQNEPCVTIEQWEDAGAALVTALGDYAKLSLSLTPKSLDEGTKSNEITAKIDPTLKAILGQMDKLSPILLRTRNRLASPFLQLPKEIISRIFMSYVFDPISPKPSWGSTLEEEIWCIHSRLHTLFHVCSSWRQMLLAEGTFWSIIAVRSRSKWPSFECSLQRAGGCKLYLVGDDTLYGQIPLIQVLTEHGPRFRAINLNIHNPGVIRDAIDTMLQQGATESLTELSVRWTRELDIIPPLPSGHDFNYILPRNHPQQSSFTKMMGALTAFRISGIQLNWDTLAFSHRLIELQVDSIMLGDDGAIIPFLHALSSASGLRDLKIISVATFSRPGVVPDRAILSSIKFPKLQSLLLQDLYLNTLELLIPIFTHARHCLRLFLTKICLRVNTLESDGLGGELAQQSELDRATVLCALLKPLSLDTLILGEHNVRRVWRDGTVSLLLKGLPTLKTLKLYDWTFERMEWNNLTRPQAAQDNPQEHPFAALENLHIVSSRIHSERGVRDMVVSHPLQRVVLGAVAETLTSVQTYKRSLEGSELVEWFRRNVPEFHLVGEEEHLSEFESTAWRLW